MESKMATVYWITGLSGAGKTTVGKELYDDLRARGVNTVLLDGDALRQVFSGLMGYTAAERRKFGINYSHLCKLLSDQGITVVCCTINMSHAVRAWNRKNFDDYVEVFLDVAIDDLIKRDSKEIYSSFLAGKITDVVGMDIVPELPKAPDIVINNDGHLTPRECVDLINDFDVRRSSDTAKK